MTARSYNEVRRFRRANLKTGERQALTGGQNDGLPVIVRGFGITTESQYESAERQSDSAKRKGGVAQCSNGSPTGPAGL